MLEANLRTGELFESEALKTRYAQAQPYADWMRHLIHLHDLPTAQHTEEITDEAQRVKLCKAFHYTQEDMQSILLPMAKNAAEPIVSMGADEPIAALSKTHPSLFDYFKQRFAQVTNPPIDALREEIKTDCSIYIGDDGNLLTGGPDNCTVLELPSPVLTEEELGRIRVLAHPAFSVRTVSLLYSKETSLRAALDAFFAACDRAYGDGINILILSDRGVDKDHLAIPSLLAVSALEQHLIHIKKRTAVSVILESGEPRDVHQLALLIAYGARAVNPYLAHDCVKSLCEKGFIQKMPEEAVRDYDRALTVGVLKIASKMGVSTLQAYQSAQLFEAVGDHGCEYMTGGRVAVLGTVGDNFAAGMSGGIAWVLDEKDTLKDHMNPSHVKTYAVSPNQAGELQRLLQLHERATGSKKAKEILAHFDAYLSKFKAVISDEYLSWMKGS